MRYRYFTCDVFTDRRFGGNPLAVLPDAQGLRDAQMQQIAREFNYSETTFVFAPEAGHTRRVRIFTPTTEVPFAGHPNIGTAFVLASQGELGTLDASTSITFEEKAGLVPIQIETRDDGIRCELEAPETLWVGPAVAETLVASAVSLSPDDLVTTTHPPQVASVGLPFLFAELRDVEVLARARPRRDGLEALRAEGAPSLVHLYTLGADGFDLQARMFAPLEGVPEDPATGSANCGLSGLLAHHAPAETGDFAFRIAQGVEMGRPSVLEARAVKRGGAVAATYIGGTCVSVAEGMIETG